MIIIGCDLETTGLDECQDDILEIALVAIKTPEFQIVDRFETAVVPTEFAMNRLRANAFVLEMHRKSGLLAILEKDASTRVVSSPCTTGIRPRAQRLPFREEAEREAIAFYDKHMQGVKSPLFGANPGFDRGFLKSHMSELANRFHYRSLDINSLWLLRKYVMGEDPQASKNEQKHRAMADCERAVETVREHFDWMAALIGAVA